MNTPKLKSFFAAAILLAFGLQIFPFAAAAQNMKVVEKELISDKEIISRDEPATEIKNKVAPDLQAKTDEQSYGFRADETQKVIIQLKSETPFNEMFGNNLSEKQRDALFSGEVRANKEKSGIFMADLRAAGGNYKKSFNRLGLVSAELPLSKIRELANSENVAYISPDREMAATGHLETTTGAANIRNLFSPTTPLYGDGIGVAIMDSGIDGSHMLNGAAAGENRPGVVFEKDFTMTCTWCWDTNMDLYGHGTHVTTMLAGRAAIAQYRGVAPNVRLLNLRVLDGQGRGNISNAIAALDWAIANKTTHNIRVINMSFGTPASDSYLNDPLCQAARRAVNAGIVVVASAGNNGKDTLGNKLFGTINSPGIEPSVITVGAVNTLGTDFRSDDTIATYSSRGPTRGYATVNGVRKYDNLIKPDLVAPGNKLIGATGTYNPGNGTRINSALAATYSSLVTNPQADPYARNMYLSGTSMSTPVVSGTVALMLQANPKLTPNLVKAILMYSAQPLNGYSTLEQGAGELNVDGALRITKLVKATLPTSNGTALLTASLPSSQTSAIGGQTFSWGKGVITNYGFLSGNDLMVKWQGMYSSGALMSDGTPFSGITLTKSTSKTSGTLSLYQGAIKNNGTLMSDGTLYLSANAMGGSPIPFVQFARRFSRRRGFIERRNFNERRSFNQRRSFNE